MKDCPIRKQFVDCEKIQEDAQGASYPCHLYNANSRQCVVFDISDNIRDIPQAITMLSFGLGPKKPPRVLFTSLDDYLKEIQEDKEDIFRGIVRVTRTTIKVKNKTRKSGYANRMFLYSSYIAGGQIIQFVCKYSQSQANEVVEKIKSLCLKLLLDARAGVLETKEIESD